MLETKVVKIHPERPAPNIIDEASKLIHEGGLIVYPTESAYGLGCNALNKDAVKKIFQVKRRPSGTPLPIIVSDINMLETCAFLDKRAKKLIEKFWPGPLTIALRKKPSIPDALNPKSIAARISSHPVARSLVGRAHVPLTATSANVSGRPPHYSLKQVLNDLNGSVDLIMDAGTLPKKRPSTIIDFTLGSTPKITRIGAIPTRRISELIEVEVAVG